MECGMYYLFTTDTERCDSTTACWRAGESGNNDGKVLRTFVDSCMPECLEGSLRM